MIERLERWFAGVRLRWRRFAETPVESHRPNDYNLSWTGLRRGSLRRGEGVRVRPTGLTAIPKHPPIEQLFNTDAPDIPLSELPDEELNPILDRVEGAAGKKARFSWYFSGEPLPEDIDTALRGMGSAERTAIELEVNGLAFGDAIWRIRERLAQPKAQR